jgi:hypothetical protein
VSNAVGGARADLLALPRLTVRRATGPETFDRIIRAQGLGRPFAVDRALTCGYAVVRRARYSVNRVRRRV